MNIIIKKISILFLCLCVFSSSSFANGPIKLKKGDPVPEDGYFFTFEQEQKIRLDLIKLKDLELQLELKDNLITNYKKQIKFHIETEERYKEAWLTTEDNLLEAVKANQRNKFWYMLLGIGLTIGAGFAIGAVN